MILGMGDAGDAEYAKLKYEVKRMSFLVWEGIEELRKFRERWRNAGANEVEQVSGLLDRVVSKLEEALK